MLRDALSAINSLSSLLVDITKRMGRLENEIRELQGYIYSNIEVKGKTSSSVGDNVFSKIGDYGNNPY